MKQKTRKINPVAKFAQHFQRCAVFKDRKKQMKTGYSKHKKAEVFLPPSLFPNGLFYVQ